MDQIHRDINDLDRQLLSATIGDEEKAHVIRLHGNVMSGFYKSFGMVSKLKSHLTCLCCVRKIPEHVLPCGHAL